MPARHQMHQFSVWFCDRCKDLVTALNDALREWLIPVGRHSFMVRTYGPPARVMLGGEVLGQGEERKAATIERSARGILGMSTSIDRLLEWSKAALLQDLCELGYPPGANVWLSCYLRAARARAAKDPSFSRGAAFERLQAHMGGRRGDRTAPARIARSLCSLARPSKMGGCGC